MIDQTLAKLVEVELYELQRELMEVVEKIRFFEKQYGMETEQFLTKFHAGEMGDDADYVEWFAYSDMMASKPLSSIDFIDMIEREIDR